MGGIFQKKAALDRPQAVESHLARPAFSIAYPGGLAVRWFFELTSGFMDHESSQFRLD
jgi:hypothetical protein